MFKISVLAQGIREISKSKICIVLTDTLYIYLEKKKEKMEKKHESSRKQVLSSFAVLIYIGIDV